MGEENKILINERMKEYAHKKIYINDLNVAKYIKRNIWNIKFKTENECILLNGIETKNLDWEYIIKEYKNKTGFELYENEIYVDAYIKTKNIWKKVYVARRIANSLRLKLCKEFPMEKICIILSVSLNDYCDAKIHFCMVRPDEFDGYYYSSQGKIDEFKTEMLEIMFTK